ncbi:hypothetical protein F4680DRAFT_166301 [Xylaria scruposa]|nr:hypothetical protein F4680DRAFT_166301 [Xylaria scruposa]
MQQNRLKSEVLSLVPSQNPNLGDSLYTGVDDNPFPPLQLEEHIQTQERNDNDMLLPMPDVLSFRDVPYPIPPFGTQHCNVERLYYFCRCDSKQSRKDTHFRHIQNCNKKTSDPFICKCGSLNVRKQQHISHVRNCGRARPKSRPMIPTTPELQTSLCGPSAQRYTVATIGQIDSTIKRKTLLLSPDSLATGQSLELLGKGKQEKDDEFSLDSDLLSLTDLTDVRDKVDSSAQEKDDEFSLDSDLLSLSDLTDEQEDVRDKVDSSAQEKTLNLLLQKYFASKEGVLATYESVSSSGVQAQNNKYPESYKPSGPPRYAMCQDETEPTSKGKSSSPLAMSASSSTTSSKGSKQKTTDENTTEEKQKKAGPKYRAKKVKTDNCQRVLACPYWKLDSKEHQNCGTLKITAIKYVKQHLLRSHTPKYYCQRCFMVFKDHQLYEIHRSRAQTCQIVAERHAIGIITPAKSRDLSRKSKSNLNEEQQWFVIWDILFEGRTRPSSAYVDLTLSEEFRSFREFWSREGPEVLMNELNSGDVWSLSAEQREVLGRSLLRRALQEIYNQWITNRQISDPATSSQPSSSSFGSTTAQQATAIRNPLITPHSIIPASALIPNETNTSTCSNEFGGDNIAAEELIIQDSEPIYGGWANQHTEQSYMPSEFLVGNGFGENSTTYAGDAINAESDFDPWILPNPFPGDSSPSVPGNDYNEISRRGDQSNLP